MTMEPPDAQPDLVGRTSARLLADGVERHDRLEALHLLAVLDASTDSTGRVRRPLDDLAAEFELAPMGVLRSLDHLEHAGAIVREGAAVVLVDREHGGVGGLQLAAFLDDVRAALGDEPEPVQSRSPWRMRAGAALVAAAAVAVVTLAPSQPAVEQPLAAGSATTARSTETTVETPAIDNSTAAPDRSVGEQAVPTSSASGGGDVGIAAGTCPAGAPTAQVVGTLVRITNPTTADIVVQKLTVGGVPSTATFVVAAGQTVERQIPAAVAALDASVDGWDWSDPALARRCES